MVPPPILIDPQRWYTVPEVAAFLGVTATRVQADCRARRMAGALFPRGRGQGEWWVPGVELLRLRPDLPALEPTEAAPPGPFAGPAECEVGYRAAVLDRLERLEAVLSRVAEALGTRPPPATQVESATVTLAEMCQRLGLKDGAFRESYQHLFTDARPPHLQRTSSPRLFWRQELDLVVANGWEALADKRAGPWRRPGKR